MYEAQIQSSKLSQVAETTRLRSVDGHKQGTMRGAKGVGFGKGDRRQHGIVDLAVCR